METNTDEKLDLDAVDGSVFEVTDEKEFPVLAAGVYPCKFEGATFQMRPKYKEPDHMEQTVMFKWSEPNEGANITKICPAKINCGGGTYSASSCFSIVKGMYGKPIPEEIYKDKEAFLGLIKGYVGKVYNLPVKPSKDGKYNNLSDPDMISPAATATPPPATGEAVGGLSFNDDDIPF